MSPNHPYLLVIIHVPVLEQVKYMTGMKKPCLNVYTKYTTLHYFNYLTVYVSYTSSVNCIGFPIVSCTISKSFIDTLCLDKKLLKFKV